MFWEFESSVICGPARSRWHLFDTSFSPVERHLFHVSCRSCVGQGRDEARRGRGEADRARTRTWVGRGHHRRTVTSSNKYIVHYLSQCAGGAPSCGVPSCQLTLWSVQKHKIFNLPWPWRLGSKSLSPLYESHRVIHRSMSPVSVFSGETMHAR